MAKIVNIGGESQSPNPKEPDAHGQAALMLVESILHALVEARTITSEGALSIVESAQEVEEEIGKDQGNSRDAITQSRHLLGRMATSFGSDLRP
jgi:hypothetical protein